MVLVDVLRVEIHGQRFSQFDRGHGPRPTNHVPAEHGGVGEAAVRILLHRDLPIVVGLRFVFVGFGAPEQQTILVCGVRYGLGILSPCVHFIPHHRRTCVTPHTCISPIIGTTCKYSPHFSYLHDYNPCFPPTRPHSSPQTRPHKSPRGSLIPD